MRLIIFITVIFVLLIGGTIFLPNYLTRRAIFQVIRIFRERNAVEMNNAKTIDELRLRPPDFFQRMMSLRDYKPGALQILIKAGVVLMTEDGRLYITEAKLNEYLNR